MRAVTPITTKDLIGKQVNSCGSEIYFFYLNNTVLLIKLCFPYSFDSVISLPLIHLLYLPLKFCSLPCTFFLQLSFFSRTSFCFPLLTSSLISLVSLLFYIQVVPPSILLSFYLSAPSLFFRHYLAFSSVSYILFIHLVSFFATFRLQFMNEWAAVCLLLS
jgi:hypothetical protein